MQTHPLLLTALLLFVAAAGTQAEPTRGALGPFVFGSTLEDAGWSAEDPMAVLNLLRDEQVEEPASMLWTSPAGARVFGMFWESRTGAIAAIRILPVAVPTAWVEDWGLAERDIEARLISEGLPTGVTAVRIDAAGRGSNLRFHPDGPERIVGIWVLIPVVFEDGARLRSGVLRLFFRGLDNEEAQKDRAAFEVFLRRLALRATLWSPREFYMDRGGLDWRGDAQTAVSTPPTTPPIATEQPSDLSRLLADALTADPVQAIRRREALQVLHARFPANPYFAVEAERAATEAKERATIEQWLNEDADGRRARALRSLHAAVLTELRQSANDARSASYLGYLDRVWPDHGLDEDSRQN